MFVKGYEFLSFAKNTGKNIGKNVNNNLSNKCTWKFLDHAEQSATDALKTTSKRVIQKKKKKKAEATSDLISKKTADRVTKVTKN